MKSTGLFGGTFDPVHRGHIELARYAMRFCNLDKIVFIPAASPPHKANIRIASFQHRIEMLKLATSIEEKFSVSTIEENLTPPSFTIDTLNRFMENKDLPVDYYFLIGIDAFLEIHTWKESEKVLNSVNFIVSSRKGYSSDLYHAFIKSLRYTREGSFWYSKESSRKIYYLNTDIPGISSSTVRESIQNDTLSDDLVDPAVLQYINQHQLYT